MCWRTCSARKKKKWMTCSGCPWNFARNTGSCVAMPTEQVFRWHLRIMMQPMEISGMVEKPNCSAPSSAGDHHVASGLQLAVGLHPDAAAQIVQQQHLLRLRQAQLPRQPRVLDRTLRRCARASRVAGDQHHVGVRLGDARGHRAHPRLRHQLHRNARPAGSRSSGRRSTAPGLRSSRCRGAAAEKPAPRRPPNSAAAR